ncbi:MAG: hypothetical protein LBL56_04450 [Treponema sp.]|nr:hypothetical protein [Treponema sp.]
MNRGDKPARFAALLAAFALTLVLPGCAGVEHWWDFGGEDPSGVVETRQTEEERKAEEARQAEEARRAAEEKIRRCWEGRARLAGEDPAGRPPAFRLPDVPV